MVEINFADKDGPQRKLVSNKEHAYYRSEQNRQKRPQFLVKSNGARLPTKEPETSNWKKKDEAEIVEYQEISEKETTRENHEKPPSMLEAPDPAKIGHLEAKLDALGKQETQLQGRLDSLEQFLFKEKDFDWGEKKNRPFHEESSLASISSVREMVAESDKGGINKSALDEAEPEVDHGEHFRPPRLHRRDQPQDPRFEVVQ